MHRSRDRNPVDASSSLDLLIIKRLSSEMLKSALRHPILRALVVVAAMVSACTGADLRTPYTESELQIAAPMGDTGRANLG